ncbi:MAG: hypothetical protein HQK87_05280 [Nitrospinae bacterium]|nr:hypothetical protein [Nitrospinota bacterium]
MNKMFLAVAIFVSLFAQACDDDTPPSALLDTPAGIGMPMGDRIFSATWNDGSVTPGGYFDQLAGEDKKWVKEKEGVWYIAEIVDGVERRHYFLHDGTSGAMTHVPSDLMLNQ